MLQVLLPDMELIVNLGDWPLNKKDRQPAFPVFSWCGSEETRDIIWPTWDLMKATIMGMDRWVSVCCKREDSPCHQVHSRPHPPYSWATPISLYGCL